MRFLLLVFEIQKLRFFEIDDLPYLQELRFLLLVFEIDDLLGFALFNIFSGIYFLLF